MVELLLAHKADVRAQNKEGRTALHCAAGYGYLEVVTQLLAKGADARVEDAEGKTAMDLAKSYGNNPCVVAALEPT